MNTHKNFLQQSTDFISYVNISMLAYNDRQVCLYLNALLVRLQVSRRIDSKVFFSSSSFCKQM